MDIIRTLYESKRNFEFIDLLRQSNPSTIELTLSFQTSDGKPFSHKYRMDQEVGAEIAKYLHSTNVANYNALISVIANDYNAKQAELLEAKKHNTEESNQNPQKNVDNTEQRTDTENQKETPSQSEEQIKQAEFEKRRAEQLARFTEWSTEYLQKAFGVELDSDTLKIEPNKKTGTGKVYFTATVLSKTKEKYSFSQLTEAWLPMPEEKPTDKTKLEAKPSSKEHIHLVEDSKADTEKTTTNTPANEANTTDETKSNTDKLVLSNPSKPKDRRTNPAMQLAKQIRKPGEKWPDAVKRAGQMLKEQAGKEEE